MRGQAGTALTPDASGPAPDVRTLTPTRVRELLDRHGLAPRRAAGQNFVVDPNTVRRIVDAAGLAPSDVVLEIGPGLGSLTLALADRAARVVAVEIDAGLVAALAEVLADTPNVTVVHADALDVDLAALVGGGPARLVANLPYNVATPIVLTAMASGALTDALVMVQREVGERWAAGPGDPAYAAVSVKLRLLADVTLAFAVPRAVFRPVPNVDSVMVRLVRRPDAPEAEDFARIAAVVDRAFATRRKALRNALATGGVGVVDVEAACTVAGIDPRSRAEEHAPEDLVRLADALAARGTTPTGPRARTARRAADGTVHRGATHAPGRGDDPVGEPATRP